MIEGIFLIKGFVGVAVACGITLASLAIKNESGLFISLWPGLIALVLVAILLAIIHGLLQAFPSFINLLSPIFKSLFPCILFWLFLAVIIMFIGTLISNPGRLGDVGFYVPIGSLYGIVSGIVFGGLLTVAISLMLQPNPSIKWDAPQRTG